MTSTIWILAALMTMPIQQPSGSTEVDDVWVVPESATSAKPYWAVKGGLGVSIAPFCPVRGLIGIHAPYLDLKEDRVINFIAIEPIVEEARGYSELEHSPLDNKSGLRLWTSNDFLPLCDSSLSQSPATGKRTQINGVDALTFYIYTERFQNGSIPIVQIILTKKRPREVGFRIYRGHNSEPFRSCILTATMGNYARLRRLWLKDETVFAWRLWPDFGLDNHGFAAHRQWPLQQLFQDNDGILVAADSNESDLQDVQYSPGVPSWWRYPGIPSTQYWRKTKPINSNLVVRVNARTHYYGQSCGRIPGGIAFENFEVEEPFCEGQEFWFGVTRKSPVHLGLKARGL